MPFDRGKNVGDKSKIEWTDATWNPIVGCSIVSPGCTNCYAMRIAPRTDELSLGTPWVGSAGRLTKNSNAGPVWTGAIRFVERRLTDPLRWKRPRMIFVNSMGDLFHESIPDGWIDKVFAVMALAPQHTFQVLTKRAERMREYITATDRRYDICQVIDAMIPMRTDASRAAKDRVAKTAGDTRMMAGLPNVWLGVSCERQQEADERIPHLLQTPAAIRFVSAEPLLGPIQFHSIPARAEKPSPYYDLTYSGGPGLFDNQGRRISDHRIDWIIVGGESGPHARPMHPQWARDIRDQCDAADVAFFFKQWGEWATPRCEDHLPGRPVMVRSGDIVVRPDGRCAEVDLKLRLPEGFEGAGSPMRRLGKKSAGRLLDGKEYNAFPNPRPSSLEATTRCLRKGERVVVGADGVK